MPLEDRYEFNSVVSNPQRNPRRFWVVLRANGNTGGRLKFHASEESARAEAQRLASEVHARFFVLEATSVFQPSPKIVEVEFAEGIN
jgi:hypothetical protein